MFAAEQRLVPGLDTDAARAVGRKLLSGYLALANYPRTLEQHGFTASELDNGATDEAVDALTPHGTTEELAAVVQCQLDAGADQVCVQVLPAREDPSPALERLAAELGLSG